MPKCPGVIRSPSIKGMPTYLAPRFDLVNYEPRSSS